MDFLQFSGPKTQKILPGRDATCVRCRISFIFGVGFPGGAPTRCQKLRAFHETAQVLGVEGGGFGMGRGDPRAHVSPSHPPNGPIFFARATVPYEGTHAKIRPVSSPYGFSTIFRAETPEIVART